MARITGIGGLFFRARDPAALASWYETHLGIGNIHTTVWRQDAGTTIFGPFNPIELWEPSAQATGAQE